MSQYLSEIYGASGIYAKVVAHSHNPFVPDAPELFTLELNYHRFIHSEFMTHRMFSRNASSSRALPVMKVLQNIGENPAIPVHWGKNQAGMQADGENSTEVLLPGVGSPATQDYAWRQAARVAREYAAAFNEAGYHKQIVNRITEPYAFIKVVVTATEWKNFFDLRDHPDAQPEIRELSACMKSAMLTSRSQTPETGFYPDLIPYVHAPYTNADDMVMLINKELSITDLMKISTGRCARVSYLNHDKTNPDFRKDIELHDDLEKSKHMSPFEHGALMMLDDDPETAPPGATHQTLDKKWWSGNFKQWTQYRQTL